MCWSWGGDRAMVGVCNHSRESSTLDCGDGCISVYHEHVVRGSSPQLCDTCVVCE